MYLDGQAGRRISEYEYPKFKLIEIKNNKTKQNSLMF